MTAIHHNSHSHTRVCPRSHREASTGFEQNQPSICKDKCLPIQASRSFFCRFLSIKKAWMHSRIISAGNEFQAFKKARVAQLKSPSSLTGVRVITAMSALHICDERTHQSASVNSKRWLLWAGWSGRPHRLWDFNLFNEMRTKRKTTYNRKTSERFKYFPIVSRPL